MKYLKTFVIIIILVVLIQVLSYITFGKNQLIEEVGLNYKSMVLDIGNNRHEEFFFISNLDFSEDQINKYFNGLQGKAVSICPSIEECTDYRNSEYFYNYFIEEKSEFPFVKNSIIEWEMVHEFAVSWKSKYVWIVYKWILMEKKMTGIS